MSGPLQWTPRGLVPAMTSSRSAEVTGASVDLVEPHDADADEDDVVDVQTAPRPVAKRHRAAPAAASTPKDVVRMARRRLREVEAEIKRLRRLERERDELKRLVDAASNKPRAVVREIKRSAG